MLAGEGDWACDAAAPTPRRAGAVIHHASFARHSSRTGAHPILAAWRWSGDIGWDSYLCDAAQAAAESPAEIDTEIPAATAAQS